jgi:hypothetical protein
MPLLLFALFAAAMAALPAQPVVLSDDGGWCWYEDERVVVHSGKLIAGTVAAGTRDPNRKGNIEAVSYDLKTGRIHVAVLHSSSVPDERKRWHDDHNSPAFLPLKDGRLLAMYSKHGPEERIYYRISERPHDPAAWQPERIFIPSPTSRVTYTNLHRLGKERRIYDFFRGLHSSNKPSYAWSEDEGRSWTAGNVFIDVPSTFRHRPYAKYASNGEDTVHIVYTDGHPRDFDNSLYHIYYRGGNLHRSGGEVIRSLKEGLKEPAEGTIIFKGDPNNVAWSSDLHLDSRGRPFTAYSVQKDSAGLPSRQGGEDHRYRYARWDGSQWVDHEIAFAGHKLYPGEDDYTGNVALDPQDPDSVYISTNADPVTGKPLISAADGRRHWEIYRGRTADGGAHWKWTPVTQNSDKDNIRPIVPIWKDKRVAALWLRGKMRTYTDYDFEVVLLVEPRRSNA